MKRVFLFTALILALVASVAMAAGAAAPAKKGALDIWVGAGYAKSLESNSPKGSFGALGGVNYFMTPDIAVGVMAGYLIYGKSDTTVGTVTTKMTASVIPITGQVTYFIPAGGFRPYFGAGAGLYALKAKVDDGTNSISNSESKFGFNVGAGFDVPAGSSMAVGVDAKVHFISGAAVNDDGTTKMGKMMSIMGAVHFK